MGYTLDHLFGDSEYTGKEMFVDSVTGALGGGLIRPLASVGTRFGKVVRHYGDDTYKVGASAVDDLIVAGYISAPMVSRPARMEFIGGAVAGLVYDIAYGKSPDVSSEQNATDVTSGGTPSRKPKDMVEPNFDKPRNVSHGNRRSMFCPAGYELRKVNKKWMCVRIRK